jgi:hypothetical protein
MLSFGSWKRKGEIIMRGLKTSEETKKQENHLKIGDYVYFGRYKNQSILWRVINLDDNNNPLLWSEYILCQKAFDAAESGSSGQTGSNPYTDDTDRQKYGSNKWENSNIREWLNSDKENVEWTTQPPTKNAVYDGRNPYDTEAGFLYNFTERERSLIKTVSNKVLLADIDKNEKDGGTESHEYRYFSPPNEAVQNYDSSYYKMINDKVFLLSIKDLSTYVQKRDYEWRKTKISQNSFIWHWTSSPDSSYSSLVRLVFGGGDVNYYLADTGSGGVVPALYLNKESAVLTCGDGTFAHPYIIKN